MTKSRIYTLLMAALLLVAVTIPAQAYEAITGPTGILKYDREKAYDGYTLFSPMIGDKTTYLIDMEGNIVHTWKSEHPALYAELLPNGNLLRIGRPSQVAAMEKATGKKLGKKDLKKFIGVAGATGIVQEIDWNGKVVWEYEMLKPWKEASHHSCCRLPNGNTMILGWEYMTREEALKNGRDPKTIPAEPIIYQGASHDGFWNDFVREVDPEGKTVWEWHTSDHFGKGPRKLDFNYTLPKGVGEIYATFDWSHFNSVAYIPETDTVVLSSRNLSEIYFIDHKTGEIKKRWGNDTAWNNKAQKPGWYANGDQELWGQHCATPLKNGNVLIFDNGSEAPETRHSRVVEMDPKTGKIVWEYFTDHSNSFATHRQGGIQRLPNGNTLVCSSHGGHVFEVTKDKKIVWEFITPFVKGVAKCVMDEDDALPHKFHDDSMWNMIHRAFRYGPDYPGLKGKDLTPQGYVCGDDCPRFFSAFRKGATLGGGEQADEESDSDDDDGPAMHAY